MRKAILAIVLILAAAAASASNTSQYISPFQGPSPCSGCDVGQDGIASCYAADAGDWADCAGGQMCFYDPGLGWYCEPYCGQNRCLYV